MRNRKWQVVVSVSLVAVVTLVSFLGSLDNDFTNWDDDKYVTENHTIRNPSWTTLKTIFTSSYLGTYCPLVILSYTLEYALWELNPFGYHLTNLLLHVGNTLLVFALVLRLSSHLLPALVAALLFGVHPLHVESVAWVTERKDVLSTLFFLSALLCYLRYSLASTQKSPPPWRGRIKEGGNRYLLYTLSLLAFLFSLLSKPMGVTIPFVLFLCDYLSARPWTTRTLAEKVPFVMVSALFSVVTVLTQHSGGGVDAARLPALGDNVLMACWGLIFYLGKTLAPVGLSAFYPYPPEVSLRLPAFFLSPILLLALTAGVWISRRYTRTVVFGSLFFFLTLLPVLKIIPIGEAAAADRYMYIPSVGLFYLAGVAFQRMYTYRSHWEGAKKVSLTAFLSLTILTLAVLTWQRCNVWQDSETLWLNVLKSHPGVHLAYNNLGLAYEKKGLLEEAIVQYQNAIALDPKYALAHNNLGAIYEKKGQLEAATAEYQKAIALEPRYVKAHANLGAIYAKKGQLEAATAEYQKAIALDPTYVRAHNNLGAVYERKGLLEGAIAEYKKVLALDPKNAITRNNLGAVYGRKELLEEAIAEYHKAIAADPRYARPHYNLGIVYRMQGKLEAAIAEFHKALALDPTYARAHHDLALAYFHKGSHREAIKHYDQARELGYSGDSSLAEALSPYRQAQ